MPIQKQFGSLLLIFVVSSLVIHSESFAQRGGPVGRGNSLFELLFQPDVKQELELVEEQDEQIRELGKAMRESIRSYFGEIRDLPGEERREAIMSYIQEERAKAEDKLEGILLEDQFARLKQLQFQSRVQRGGASRALQTEELREKLKLTEEQISTIQTTSDKAQAELREKIQQATQEAREKILAVLTPDQLAIFNELAGTTFTFQRRDRRLRPGGPERRYRLPPRDSENGP